MQRGRLPHLRVLPQTRADCKDMLRPCPYVSCRHHLFLDIASDGRLFMNTQADEADEDSIVAELEAMQETCALDVADRGEHLPLEDVADVMGVSHVAIHLVERRAADKLRVLLADEHPDDSYFAHMARKELKK